jgi:Fe-Mn family superoxide dismutase
MEKIKPLAYEYDALEPYIDEATMRVHYDKHFQAYFDKFNKAVEYLEEKDVEKILRDLSKIPKEIREVVVNNGGGYFNHDFFWQILKKDVSFKWAVSEAIKSKWGDFDNFKKEFSDAAVNLFGSGWVWLVVNELGELQIIQTKNQDSPISIGKMPVLGLDVWEHAYYLKYQNRRAEYVQNFFKVINWEKVNEFYLKARE